MSVETLNEEQQLINQYHSNDYLLSFPSKNILGKGKAVELTEEEQRGLSFRKRIESLLHKGTLNGMENPIVIGALPFHQQDKGTLVIPEEIQQSEVYQNVDNSLSSDTISSTHIQSIPSGKEYAKAVEKITKEIKEGKLEKAVLGRVLQIDVDKQPDISHLIQNLITHNHDKYNFALNTSEEGKEKTLIGASPELLISKKGSIVVSNPLAGSRPRQKDPEKDVLIAQELRHSEKDLHEHQLVVQSVLNALRPFCKKLHVPEEPSVIHTETMWHLSSEIIGHLEDPYTQSIEIAENLHPTPAICGTPNDIALENIRQLEPFNRDYFTGLIGWSDKNGDGEWAITIRCAEIEENTIRMFAGAGIVKDSVPEEEKNETAAKLQTMLRVFGIDFYEEEGNESC
ncbi:isochorismate synthase DhbC [Oceanobacillus kimchii]|uniref:isochorismate synthase DhbC n=1 Tax=Oceanobacillus kimchii TaxID=746691 RepID=UPI0021A792E4|nr:isochorismate synthase DhbC [Oceanobacillus kimchii]MCT1578463.1 isochorismate synthase DhbC [Oceanobacillus kimchii]MCT2136488.1 isochorismate synthase DhbC [Oceanobacillus kimchii]